MEGREAAPSRPPNPAMPYREDCWSEGETSALVDAWGDRYLELNRGNLRQKHWQEVADAVNSRRGAARPPPRTDLQCKNRIDTLKKKYKVEKARTAGPPAAASRWPFFPRLDALIGSSAAAPKKPSPLPLLALPLPHHRKRSPLPVAAVRPVGFRDDSVFLRAAAAAAAAAAEDDMVSPSGSSPRCSKGWRRARERELDGIRELARAIERLAEIYQRVEEAKQRQMMELEKKRMDFAREMELERMQSFVDSQVQLAKIKRAKR